MPKLATTANRDLQRLAEQLRTVGDDCRLCILCVLIDKKRAYVGEIAAATDLSIATVSHHLQVLMANDIVESERDGKRIYYTLAAGTFVSDIKRQICKYK